MTTLYLSPIGILLQQFTNLGQPLAGGKVNTYVGGSVNTPVDTWTDSTGTTKNANPIILNEGGRLANSLAPVSVWVPANTPHKMVLADSAGGQLALLDNIYGINDPTAILAALQASGGVDSIANAVRSYDIVSTLRTASQPSLAAGVTLIVVLQGAVTINDGLGGAFYWAASSSATDDGINVVKLTATTGAGRFVRVNWDAAFGLDSSNGQWPLGWLGTPQNIQAGNYQFVLSDRGKQVYHANAAAHLWTIPANSLVAFENGTVIDIVNDNGAGNLTIAITTDTLRWAPVGSVGSRTLAANGSATIKKMTATSWQISGVNLS